MRLTAQGWPTEGHQHAELTEAPHQRFSKVELEWSSRETDLRIAARRVRPGGSPEHRGPDYVWLYVTLRDVRSWRIDDWTVTAVLTIQPADQLDAIAQGVHALAGPLG
jgi:hypothetical protein